MLVNDKPIDDGYRGIINFYTSKYMYTYIIYDEMHKFHVLDHGLK